MKIVLTALILATMSTSAFAARVVNVNGYTRSNGTYVAPHVRTAPDNTVTNNFSYRPSGALSGTGDASFGGYNSKDSAGYNGDYD